MSASVRLRLIDGLRCVIDHCAKNVSKHLRGYEIQSHPRADRSFANPTFEPGSRQREMYNAIEGADIDYGVGAGQRYLDGLHNDPVYIANSNRLSASNYNFVAHQKFPSGSLENPVDLSRLNASASGVES